MGVLLVRCFGPTESCSTWPGKNLVEQTDFHRCLRSGGHTLMWVSIRVARRELFGRLKNPSKRLATEGQNF
jgi:hypothetical protein